VIMSTQMLMHSKQPQVPFVDLAAQYRTIEREINEATSRVIQQTDFILGREVSLFEEEFAAFCEAKYTVGVDSGTSALELALRAFDIGPGDEVITAANSFIASALAISHVGADPRRCRPKHLHSGRVCYRESHYSSNQSGSSGAPLRPSR